MKTAYLDTCFWIELEHISADGNDSRQPILQHVENLIYEGSLCLPLSITHCQEMVKHGNIERRRRLWTFATRLSGCIGMVNKQALLPLLIEEAVHNVFGVEFVRKPAPVFTRNCLFGLDFGGDFPLPEALLATEYGWNHFWLEMPDEIHQKFYAGLNTRESVFSARRNSIKDIFKKNSHFLRKRAYIARLFLDMQELYQVPFARLGKTLADIEALTMDDHMRLVTKVAPLDVEVALAIQHQQQWDRQETENDVRDISHLCLAVPYCDVVLTERYWVDKIKREKLDAKYQTEVASELSFLLQL